MKKKIISLSLCFFLLVFKAYIENASKFHNFLNPSFESTILKKFAKNNFDDLMIIKRVSNKDDEIARINNPQTVDKVLEYLKSIKLKEIDPPLPKIEYPKNYTLCFYNRSTHEELTIEILNEEYVEIHSRLIKKTKVKKNWIRYDNKTKYAHYKLNEKKIDMKFIDNILNSFKNNE